MIRRTPEELCAVLKAIFIAAGADEANAEIVAAHLMGSELVGVETHGIRPLAVYMQDIREGQLQPAAKPEIRQETDSSALISGNWTFGHVAAEFGMEVAIEKASANNIAVVSLVQLHHIGRLGHYPEIAARAGMVAMVFGSGYCKSAPRAAPYEGRQRVLDVNPVSIGFPNDLSHDQRPFLLDYATTVKAQGALFLAEMRGQQLPPGWVIDKDGNPTTDAGILGKGGALLPFGGYKGYALMVATEYLGRVVSGAEKFTDQARGGDMFRHQGVTMIVLKADLFQSMQDYATESHETAQRIRASQPADGVEQVLIPGDPEATAREANLRDGIPIADDLWDIVVEAGASVGLKIDPGR